MRVLFTSNRLTGHVRPLLPYAEACVARGHEVLMAAPEAAAAMITEEGFAHAPFDDPVVADLSKIVEGDPALNDKEGRQAFFRQVSAAQKPEKPLPQLREIIRRWGADLIVRESMEFSGLLAAEAEGVPHFRIEINNGHLERKTSTTVAETLDRIRQTIGLAPDNGAAIRMEAAFTSFPASLDAEQPVPESPFRVKTPRAAAADGPAPHWAPTNGEPLVYVSFGTLSTASTKSRAMCSEALAALSTMPVQVLVSTGRAIETAELGAFPNNVTVVPWVAEREVFPRASVVICHGGAGTVLAALRHGVPLVVSPNHADQPDNALRVDVAEAGIAIFKPEEKRFRKAVQRILERGDKREGALRIAREMEAMPDLSAAIERLEALTDGGHDRATRAPEVPV